MRNPTFFLAKSGRMPAFLTRFRLLITSVLRDIGRGRLCNFKNKPQALHRTAPNSSRRQRGVVEVLQLWHVGWEVSRLWLAGVAIVFLLDHTEQIKGLRESERASFELGRKCGVVVDYVEGELPS